VLTTPGIYRCFTASPRAVALQIGDSFGRQMLARTTSDRITAQGRSLRLIMRAMAKRRAVPKRLPISPLSLTCPRCNAKRNQDCMTTSGGFAAIHIERIQMAALGGKVATLRNKTRRSAER
jgi:hypothetical protein